MLQTLGMSGACVYGMECLSLQALDAGMNVSTGIS